MNEQINCQLSFSTETLSLSYKKVTEKQKVTTTIKLLCLKIPNRGFKPGLKSCVDVSAVRNCGFAHQKPLKQLCSRWGGDARITKEVSAKL